MKSKFPVLIYDGVAGICATLKADDNIRLIGQCICNLSLAFIAPVCTNNCLNHDLLLYTEIVALTPRRSLLSFRRGFMTSFRYFST